MKPNQIDILAFTVLRHLEQIDETQETRLSCQLWSNIRKTDRLDRIHFDLTFFHTVPRTHFHARLHPYSDTASDFSATNSFAKTFGEDHEQSLHKVCYVRGDAVKLLPMRTPSPPIKGRDGPFRTAAK